MLAGDRAELYKQKPTSGVSVADAALAAYESLRASEGADWLVLSSVSASSVGVKATGRDGHAGLERALARMSADVTFGACAYWAGDARCGAIPLYRLYSGAAGNHFYTTSAPERDNAVSVYGYVEGGIAAYVWPSR
jgi:hypothetical protein